MREETNKTTTDVVAYLPCSSSSPRMLSDSSGEIHGTSSLSLKSVALISVSVLKPPAGEAWSHNTSLDVTHVHRKSCAPLSFFFLKSGLSSTNATSGASIMTSS